MPKEFNITGTCIPQKHYMGDISGKIARVNEMIARGDYFTINRPRQYGKTTVMYMVEQELLKDKSYLVLDISFEGIGTSTYSQEERFIPTFLNLLKQRLLFKQENELAGLIESNKSLYDFGGLNFFITEFIIRAARNVVLMIDEVDKSSENQLFLDFLGMLRAKFLKRNEGKDHTFHSVILAGVHDIKTLKSKIHSRTGNLDSPQYDTRAKYNSPWNIAVDFRVDLSLAPDEIIPMLREYSREKNVSLDIPLWAEKIFFYTSGYPFLVSNLCKIIDEEILPGKPSLIWEIQDIEAALQIMVRQNNTNFEELVKNLENNAEIYDLVFKIIMNEGEFSFNLHNSVILLGEIYGILKEEKGKARIHNRIYEQVIYNYMISNLEISGAADLYKYEISTSYIEKDGSLNIEKVLKKFQQFMKEQYNDKDTAFIERNGRLLFLAFLKPIINHKGFDFKEVQVSQEKRLDVVVTFGNKKYIIELKLWRGEKYHRKGIEQLCDYLDRQNETKGYLLIFDLRKESGRIGETLEIKTGGKEILAAWV